MAQELALDAIEKGWGVVPLGDNKAPCTSEWKPDRPMWEAVDVLCDWPGHATHIGLVPPEGRFILDVDNKGDVHGDQDLAELQAEYTELPSAPENQTPNGGRHLFFALPEGYDRAGNVDFRDGIETKGTNKYVAFGPRYDGRVPGPDELPEAPDWLAQIVVQGTDKPDEATRQSALVEPDLPQNVEKARDYLRRCVANEERLLDGRKQRGFRLGAEMRSLGLSFETARDVIEETGAYGEWIEPHEDPGLFWQQVRGGIVRGKARPGQNATSAADAFDDDVTARASAPAERDEPDQPNRFTPQFYSDEDHGFPFDPPEFLIENAIPKGKLCRIVGVPGSGKSFIALDLAWSLASGRSWLGMAGPSQPQRVAYVAAEDASGMTPRSNAWLDYMDEQGGRWPMAIVGQGPDFSSDDEAREFGQAMHGFNPDVVVIDTQVWTMGEWDENATKDAQDYVARLRRLQDTFDCTVILIHHPPASSPKRARGNSAIVGAVDVELTVQMLGEKLNEGVALDTSKPKSFPEWEKPINLFPVDRSGSIVLRPQGESQDQQTERAVETFTREMQREELGNYVRQQADRHTRAAKVAVRVLDEDYRAGGVYRVLSAQELAKQTAGLMSEFDGMPWDTATVRAALTSRRVHKGSSIDPELKPYVASVYEGGANEGKPTGFHNVPPSADE